MTVAGKGRLICDLCGRLEREDPTLDTRSHTHIFDGFMKDDDMIRFYLNTEKSRWLGMTKKVGKKVDNCACCGEVKEITTQIVEIVNVCEPTDWHYVCTNCAQAFKNSRGKVIECVCVGCYKQFRSFPAKHWRI